MILTLLILLALTVLAIMLLAGYLAGLQVGWNDFARQLAQGDRGAERELERARIEEHERKRKARVVAGEGVVG